MIVNEVRGFVSIIPTFLYIYKTYNDKFESSFSEKIKSLSLKNINLFSFNKSIYNWLLKL